MGVIKIRNISAVNLFIVTASVVWWSEFLVTERGCIVFHVRYELNLYMLCRKK
jgi:hypothetical protein